MGLVRKDLWGENEGGMEGEKEAWWAWGVLDGEMEGFAEGVKGYMPAMLMCAQCERVHGRRDGVGGRFCPLVVRGERKEQERRVRHEGAAGNGDGYRVWGNVVCTESLDYVLKVTKAAALEQRGASPKRLQVVRLDMLRASSRTRV